jgi:hypothetical protein
MHYHRDFTLDDGDANAGTNPADGIYLMALRVDMATLDASDPFYLVFGTRGSTLEARNAAVAWVTARVDTLVVEEIPGDYNHNGTVDAADYTLWRDTLNSTTNLAADGDGSLQVGAGDYHLWSASFGDSVGSPMNAASAMSVPEPTTVGLLFAMIAVSRAALRRPPLSVQRWGRPTRELSLLRETGNLFLFATLLRAQSGKVAKNVNRALKTSGL